MKLIPALCALSIISAHAADVSYTLDFYGDSISQSLIRNNYIQSKNDTSEIEKILSMNDLDWEKAKNLPVGKVYYVERGGLKTELASDGTDKDSAILEKKVEIEHSQIKNQIDLEIGTFHHTQSINKANVYSDLSQYVIAKYERDESYGLNLTLERYQYSDDDDQNIASDKVQTNYDLSAIKIFNFKSLRLDAGIYTKSLLSFSLDDLNRVEFDSGRSSGLQVGASGDFYQKGDISIFAGLQVQKNASATNFEDYQGAQINSGLNFKYLKRDMSLVVRYGFSQMEIDSESLGERKASVGLKTIF